LVLCLGAVASLGIAALFWNRGGAIIAAGALVVISLAVTALVPRRSPDYSPWAVITASVLLITAVLIVTGLTKSSFLWIVNLPAWAIGPVFWALLRECRGRESGVNLVSWAIFLTIDTVVLGFFLNKFV
jgi:hypothetical protein